MKNLFIKNKVTLSKVLLAGVLVVGGGIGGHVLTKLSPDKDVNKENTNSETTTTIIETTEKPIETEETIAQTIKDIMSEETSVVTTVEEPEEITTTPIICDDAVIYANETTTTVATTEPVVTTTKEEITTTAPIVTTVAQTTKAPVVTTVQETTKAPVVTAKIEIQAEKYVDKDIDLVRFEELSQNLLDELNEKKVLKSAGTRFRKKDMYSTVYIVNIENISNELKSTLIEQGYIADDIETILTDSFVVEDAISTYNLSRLIWNTSMDEVFFGLNYFKDDPSVYFELIDDEGVYIGYNTNADNKFHTNVTDKLDSLSTETYFAARDKYYSKSQSTKRLIKYYNEGKHSNRRELEGVSSFELENFIDYSVAIHDVEAQKNVRKSLEITVEASLNNDIASKNLQNLYFFGIENQSSTSLAHCGAGADYAINENIDNFVKCLTDSQYKSLRGYAHDADEYKKILTRVKTLCETANELNNVVRIHEKCDKQLTK